MTLIFIVEIHIFQFYISTIISTQMRRMIWRFAISILHKYDYILEDREVGKVRKRISILHKYDYICLQFLTLVL